MVVTQFYTKLQVLRSNNAGEYLSCELFSFLDDSLIIHQTNCLSIPKKNEVVERKNRHLLEIAHAIIFIVNVSKTFWSFAIQIVVY